jgi:hypothetical protein
MNEPSIFERACRHCGEPFQTYHPTKDYCDYRCRKRAETGRARNRSKLAATPAADAASPIIVEEANPTRERILELALVLNLLPDKICRFTGGVPEGIESELTGDRMLVRQGHQAVWILS